MTLSADLWDRCLAQLRLQMSRATYETWLQNTTAQEEEGRLIVFTPSSFAQDWLEKRLRDTIERAVNHVAEQPIAIEFRLAKNGGYQPELFFTGTYRDAYNALVQPDAIHYTTKYFHQRWLPLLGPDLWLVIWEMRTRCYRDKTGQVVRDTFEATYAELAAAVGMSERTVWGLLHPKDAEKKALVDKFIIRNETKRRYSRKHGGTVNEKTIWKVRLDDPLTPEDEIELEKMMSPTRKICE
ncbi:MAG TPA: DnaA N-terminal domain-containing protein [Anaerolineae bacterium]|nr:DnaA N-terminal domain-containing protein [Anaerolineae bacterium]